MNRKIGIFDSGIGGLSVLSELKKILPNEDYIYYQDSKNNPYGSKSIEELRSIVDNIVKYLIGQDVKLIVIACNTATTNCLDYLKGKYPDILFVGITPAIDLISDYKKVLVLATPLTIKSKCLLDMIDKYKLDNQDIYLEECNTLAHSIEIGDDESILFILSSIRSKYDNIDCIVLGCTHYSLIKDKVGMFFKDIPLIDGNKKVSIYVKSLLVSNNLLNEFGSGKINLIVSE